MRDDQKERLADLSESVMDAFLDAADPKLWAGDGEDPAAMEKDTRGARNWDVKNANQVGALVARVLDLKERLIAGVKPPDQKPEDDPDQDIRRYEKVAQEMLKKASERQK